MGKSLSGAAIAEVEAKDQTKTSEDAADLATRGEHEADDSLTVT